MDQGWTSEQLAERTGVSLRTARRWRQTGQYPPWAAILIRVMIRGDLGAIDPAWRGWRLIRGQLVSRENWIFPPGEVLSIPLMRGQVREWRNKLKYSVQADWVDERWREPEETIAPAAQQLAR